MKSRTRSLALSALFLLGCTPRDTIPDGTALVDEEVVLEAAEAASSMRRELPVAGRSIVVARVLEKTTDVRLKLALAGTEKSAAAEIEVENNLGGMGTEIAALEVPRDSSIVVTIAGPRNIGPSNRVRLIVRRFHAASDSQHAALVAGFRAWSAATDAAHRPTSFAKSALADFDRAIASFEKPQGDAALAAEARLIKANALNFFRLDSPQARAEAVRAAQAFGAEPEAAGHVARAHLVEAVALGRIAKNRQSKAPTPEEANLEARRILTELSAAVSPLTPIERGRALEELGNLDLGDSQLADATRHFEEARALFESQHYQVGEREMQLAKANVLVEGGRFNDAVQVYLPLLAHMDEIPNYDLRVKAWVKAGRANAFSGRTDEALDILPKALAAAREYELREEQCRALVELTQVYWRRGDYLQAKSLFSDALELARTVEDPNVLVFALAGGGIMARQEGDFAKSIELHEEALSRVSAPVLRMRSMRDLALAHIGAGDYPRAIELLRGSLAVDLKNPRHHAYSDVRRDLAEALIEHGDGSKTTYQDAGELLADALRSCRAVKDVLGEISALRVNARLYDKQGKRAAALAEYERAFEQIFVYRAGSANAQLRNATLQPEQAAFRDYFDLVMKDVAARGSVAPVRATVSEEKALRMLERARESHFGLSHGQAMDAATTARVDALLAEMADKSVRIAALLASAPQAGHPAELTVLQTDMSRLRVEVDRVRTAAALESAKKENAGPDKPRTWRRLRPAVVQISYALGNQHAYVWVRSGSGTSAALLGESPEVIERELAALAAMNTQKSPEQLEQALARVSPMLLPAKLLPADSKTVEIVADGRIANVPFAGLTSPTDPTHRLVETHAITLITSMYASAEPPPPTHARPFRFVALASGSGTLRSVPVADPVPRLHAATSEINEVARLFTAQEKSAHVKLLTGSDGTKTALNGIWSSGADVVHFATHALADLRQPLASLLVLPANTAAGTPTYLTAGQVEEWRGDTDLVFLSACESAIGPPRFAGGMPGLQSAFLRAGARGVIATLWPIEDELAREFSVEFYKRFTAGETAVQALSETQREWIAGDGKSGEAQQLRRRVTAMAHGFYTR